MRTPPASLGRLWPRSRLSLCGHRAGGYQGAPSLGRTCATTWHLQFSRTGSHPRLRPHQPWLRAPGPTGDGDGALRSPATAATRAAVTASAASLGALVTATRDALGVPVASRCSGRCPCGSHSQEPEAPRGTAAGAESPAVPCRAAEASARGRPRRGASLRRTVREEGSRPEDAGRGPTARRARPRLPPASAWSPPSSGSAAAGAGWGRAGRSCQPRLLQVIRSRFLWPPAPGPSAAYCSLAESPGACQSAQPSLAPAALPDLKP